MSWTDEEIDKMFKENADGLQFEYKNAYWKEMEAMLPKGGSKGDFLWFFTSFVFLGLFGVMAVFNAQTSLQMNQTTTTGSAIAVAAIEQSDSKNHNVSNENDRSNSLATAIKVKESATGFTNYEKSFITGNDAENRYSPTNGVVQQSQIGNNEQVRLDLIESSINSWNLDSYPVNQEIEDITHESNADNQIGRLNFLGVNLIGIEAKGIKSYSPHPENIGSTFGIYIQAVGGISQSLISPSEKISNSFGLGVGTQFGKRNWSYSLGVNGIVSNHQDIVLNRSAKVYGFGSEVFNYKVNYQQLYLLEGNLQMKYSFGKHGVSIGVRPSYAFSSKVKMNQTQLENTMIETQVDDDSRSVYGYMDGLQRFGIKPMIGYSWSMMPGMELGINVGVQLKPQVNEDFIDGINNTLPIDGQIYFRKTIDFKK